MTGGMIIGIGYKLLDFSYCRLCRCTIYRETVFRRFTSRSYRKQRDLISVLSEMPKEKKSVTELRHMRLKAKNASSSVVPSIIQLYVLGNGSSGCPRCLYLLTSHGRYIFNCGEGTQRLASEHKLKLSKLEHIFITHRSWKNLGGLPGMSLTVQDIGVPSFTLHGPPGLVEIYDMMKVFIDMKDLEVGQRNYSEKSFIDNCMEVTYVPLKVHKANGMLENDKELIDEKLENVNSAVENDSLMDNFQEGARKRHKAVHIGSDDEDVSIAYICKCHNKPGQLLLIKCVEQGVPPGPLLGQLKAGQDVTLSDGRIVRSQDVVAPDEPGPIFIVLECPSVDYIDALTSEKKFEPYQASNPCESEHAAVVVHFTEQDVLSDPRYQDWMNRFPSSTSHFILNSSNNSLSTIAVHEIQHMFHLIHPEIFPLLKEDKIASAPEGSATVTYPDNMTRFSLRPRTGLDREIALKLEPESYVEEAFSKPDFTDNLQLLKEHLSAQKNGLSESIATTNYPEIAFLGTGSCIPNKVRNVSGILVNTSSETSLLLDCGEGTYSQLYRLYGTAGVKIVLKNIACIFISHLHADHHLGLIELFEARKEVLSKDDKSSMLVIAPHSVIKWLKSYHHDFNYLLHNIRLIPNIQLSYKEFKMESEEYEELLTKTGLKQIATVPVRHCKDAHGIVFTTKDDYKVVYSGDTMPCEDLVTAGQNCSLLIHEATMEDALEEEAFIKMHSTVSQAISIGEKMGANFTLLTHFSQRYAKIPLFPKHLERIGFAFDNMVVHPSDLHLLPHFLPSLKSLFAEHYEEMKEKTARRLRQKQLLEEALQEASQNN